MPAAVPSPGDAVEVPWVVRELAAGRPLRPAWRNELGGLTFEIGGEGGSERRFIKWSPPGEHLDLRREAVRLQWAVAYHPVPRVLDHGGDDESGTWLLTTALPGENAVAPRWIAEPAVATRAIGEGLRALHDALPVDACPFTWSIDERLAYIHAQAEAGQLRDPARWHEDLRHLGVDGALALLDDPPPVDRLVVCHADTCAPNTMIGDDGRWTGHVDLGSLGVADRWADLAIATWSTVWNYGSGWEGAVLDAYGIEPDPERTAYYRLLWELGP